MNKQGQVFFFTLMLAIVAIILALALSPAIKDFVTEARNETGASGEPGLHCSNITEGGTLTDFDRATCIITDLTLPYWIGIVLGLAGAAIGARLILGG